MIWLLGYPVYLQYLLLSLTLPTVVRWDPRPLSKDSLGMGGTHPLPVHTLAHLLHMWECSLVATPLMGKATKPLFRSHTRALPSLCLVEGYLLQSFRPLLLWGWPEPLTLHLPPKILWLTDGIHSKATSPLHNRCQGATPLLLMGMWGQAPLIPKLVHLVHRLGKNFPFYQL